jgi:hypothetical protein
LRRRCDSSAVYASSHLPSRSTAGLSWSLVTTPSPLRGVVALGKATAFSACRLLMPLHIPRHRRVTREREGRRAACLSAGPLSSGQGSAVSWTSEAVTATVGHCCAWVARALPTEILSVVARTPIHRRHTRSSSAIRLKIMERQ